jgi:hypothetical protein
MAIGRTERALYEAALKGAEATIAALSALEHLARDFKQGDSESMAALVQQARSLEERVREALSDAL